MSEKYSYLSKGCWRATQTGVTEIIDETGYSTADYVFAIFRLAVLVGVVIVILGKVFGWL